MPFGRKKSLMDRAHDYVEQLSETVIPQLEQAWEQTVDKAGPALADARDKATPLIAEGRDDLLDAVFDLFRRELIAIDPAYVRATGLAEATIESFSEAYYADRIVETVRAFKLIPDLIRKIDASYPTPGGAPPEPPLTVVPVRAPTRWGLLAATALFAALASAATTLAVVG